MFLMAFYTVWFNHIIEELLCLHRGQGLEILWRDSLQCPTEEEYIGMVNDSWAQISIRVVTCTHGLDPALARFCVIYTFSETGGLFRIAVKLMMACSTTNSDVCVALVLCICGSIHIYSWLVFFSDYVPLVNIFGIYFQIRDDYMNLQSTQVRVLAISYMRMPRQILGVYWTAIIRISTNTTNFDFSLAIVRDEQRLCRGSHWGQILFPCCPRCSCRYFEPAGPE